MRQEYDIAEILPLLLVVGDDGQSKKGTIGEGAMDDLEWRQSDKPGYFRIGRKHYLERP